MLLLLLDASLNSIHQILGRTVKVGQTQTQSGERRAAPPNLILALSVIPCSPHQRSNMASSKGSQA